MDITKRKENPEWVSAKRRELYRERSDPIFFQWQRGEATEKDWLDSVFYIKKEFPLPTEAIEEIVSEAKVP